MYITAIIRFMGTSQICQSPCGGLVATISYRGFRVFHRSVFRLVSSTVGSVITNVIPLTSFSMRSIFVFFVITITLCTFRVGSIAAAQDAISPEKTDALLVCVSNTWAVWRTRELIEKTRTHVAQGFIHRFYRQDLSSQRAFLVFTDSDAETGPRATVTEDGTVAILNRGHITWCLADGKTKLDPARHLQILKLYPDGVVAHDRTGHGFNSVDFVPFKNHALDFDSKVELIPAGIRRFSRSPIAREGNRLAWLRFKPNKAGNKNKTGFATLHIYNIEESKHTTIKLKSAMQRSSWATALGENILIVGGQVFDVKSGERLNPVQNRKIHRNLQNVFAIRNRIGYYSFKNILGAIDLLNPDLPSIEIGAITNPPTTTDSGVTFWDGKRWNDIEWLKQWPAPQDEEGTKK